MFVKGHTGSTDLIVRGTSDGVISHLYFRISKNGHCWSKKKKFKITTLTTDIVALLTPL